MSNPKTIEKGVMFSESFENFILNTAAIDRQLNSTTTTNIY